MVKFINQYISNNKEPLCLIWKDFMTHQLVLVTVWKYLQGWIIGAKDREKMIQFECGND